MAKAQGFRQHPGTCDRDRTLQVAVTRIKLDEKWKEKR